MDILVISVILPSKKVLDLVGAIPAVNWLVLSLLLLAGGMLIIRMVA